MKVIFICNKDEFDIKRLHLIKKYAEAIWLDSERTDLHRVKELFDDEDKILALSPSPLEWHIPDNIYNKFKNIRYICMPTTSYDFVNLEACKKNNITITNVPYYSSNAVAEYAIFLLMALLKRLPAQIKNNFPDQFSKDVLMEELGNKSVGIIGLGHIGTRIAELCSRLGLTVYYWSHKSRDKRFKFLDLNRLTSHVNILFPAMIIKTDTSKLLDTKLLQKLNKNAYVVDITHGLTDFKFLTKQVEKRLLAGYAFINNKFKLTDFKGNVFTTSSLAWFTDQSLENDIQIWADTIISCINNKPINVVNL